MKTAWMMVLGIIVIAVLGVVLARGDDTIKSRSFGRVMSTQNLTVNKQFAGKFKFSDPAGPVSLNPQPLPPGPPDPKLNVMSKSMFLSKSKFSDLGSAVSLNPQPLPPGPPDAKLNLVKKTLFLNQR